METKLVLDEILGSAFDGRRKQDLAKITCSNIEECSPLAEATAESLRLTARERVGSLAEAGSAGRGCAPAAAPVTIAVCKFVLVVVAADSGGLLARLAGDEWECSHTHVGENHGCHSVGEHGELGFRVLCLHGRHFLLVIRGLLGSILRCLLAGRLAFGFHGFRLWVLLLLLGIHEGEEAHHRVHHTLRGHVLHHSCRCKRREEW